MNKYMLIVSFNSLLFLFAEDNPFSIGEHLQQLDREKAAFLHTLHEADNSSHTVVDRRKQVNEASIRIPKKPLSSPKIKQSKTTPHHQTQQQIEIQKRISEVKKIHQERAEALRIKKHKEALLPREQEKELKKKKIKSTKRHNKKSTKKQIQLKKHKEVLLPREQEKELKKKKIKSTKRHNKKSTKKQIQLKKHKEALLPREQEKELKKKKIKSTKRHNKKSTKKQIYPERVDPKVTKSTQNNLSKPKGSTLKNKKVIDQAYIDAIKAVNQ